MVRGCSIFIVLLVQLWKIRAQAQGDMSSTRMDNPRFYDELRANPNSSLVSIFDSEESSVFQIELAEDEGVNYRLGEFKAFLPLSNGTHQRPGIQSSAFTAILALYHFNNLDISPIVTKEEIGDCDVKLTLEVIDSKFSPIGSTRSFTESLHTENTFETPKPTAVIGAYRSATTSPLAILTGVNGIPHASYASTSTDFDVKEQFPLFGRTVSSTAGEARVALDFFLSIGATHVGVLFVTDSFGSALQKAFQDAANSVTLPNGKRFVTDSVAFSFSAGEDSLEIENAVSHLTETRFRHFYVICFENHYEAIAKSAIKHGVVGPDFLWVFPGLDIGGAVEIMQADPILAEISLGMGLISPIGGVRSEPFGIPAPIEQNPTTSYEKYRKSRREAKSDPDFVDYVRSKLPESLTSLDGFTYEEISDEPSAFDPMLYDAVFGMAISLCRAGENVTFFSGSQIYNEFKNLEFVGASGNVKILPETGTRNYTSSIFVLYNVQSDERDENGVPILKMVPSTAYVSGEWTSIPGTEYIYANGTNLPPNSLPEVEMKMNYIGKAGRYAAYTLMGFVIVLSLLSMIWIVIFWNDHVVTSSQPLFLTLISLGAIIMVTSIVPLSWEEPIAVSKDELDRSCMIAPWLYIIGAIIAFSALFAKTRGIYKAYSNPELDFIHVTSLDIFSTFLWLLSLNVIIMLIWEKKAPLQWERTNRDAEDVFGRPVESYGSCTNDDSVPFLVLVLVLNFLFLTLGNWWSYKCRNIETEYLESRYIGISMAAVLQAWCMGIPILIVVWDTPQAKFFVETGIIFVTSLAFLSLIYIPKIMASITDRMNAIEEEKKKAYNDFIEARSKKSEEIYGDFDDDKGDDEGADVSTPAKETEEGGEGDSPEPEKSFYFSEDKCSRKSSHSSKLSLHSSFGNISQLFTFNGAVKANEGEHGRSGMRIVHNPRAEAILSATNGLEVSRRQLEIIQLDEEEESESESNVVPFDNGEVYQEDDKLEIDMVDHDLRGSKDDNKEFHDVKEFNDDGLDEELDEGEHGKERPQDSK